MLKHLLNRLITNKPRQTARVIGLLHKGKFDEALSLVRRMRRLSVQNWQTIAEAAAQMGPEVEATLFYAIRAGNSTYPFLLAGGRWLARHGELLRAYVFFSAAQRLAPAEAAPLLAQGEIQVSLGNFQAAASLFMAALQRDETSIDAKERLEKVRNLAGLPPHGAVNLSSTDEVASQLPPDDSPEQPQAYLDHGRWLVENKRSAQALPLLEAAHRRNDSAETGYWLTSALSGLGRYEEAWRTISAAMEKSPGDLKLLEAAANCAALTDRYTMAVDLYRRLVAACPAPSASLLSNFGISLARIERYVEAIEPLKHAAALAPRDTAVLLNLAHTLHFAGYGSQASAYLDALLSIEKNDFAARWLSATCLLANQSLSAGWRDYEFRVVVGTVTPRAIPFPLWRGQSLADKKILVTAEQGVGDQVMLLSCLPDLTRLAKAVIVECEPRLVTLFARSFPQASIQGMLTDAKPDWRKHDDADLHIPMGSLPKYFRTEPDAFAKANTPFLIPEPIEVNRFQEQLAALGSGLKVGIAWRGGSALTRLRTRTLKLEQMASVLQLPSCHFVSLQYGDCTTEVQAASVNLGVTIHHWPDILANLDKFAALTQALDVIVTVCSTPVHFSGALNKPTIVLVPHTPEWRYSSADGQMLWYPSVTLIRQPSPGDWASPLKQAAERLARLAAGRP